MENAKIRLSLLWVVGWLVGIVGNMLELYEPGVIEEIIAGEMAGVRITPELMLMMAVLFLIGPVMALLSITLKDSINRWANIIVGIFITGLGLFTTIEYLAEQTAYSAYAILIEVVGVVITALIVWYAWKWPKKKD